MLISCIYQSLFWVDRKESCIHRTVAHSPRGICISICLWWIMKTVSDGLRTWVWCMSSSSRIELNHVLLIFSLIMPTFYHPTHNQWRENKKDAVEKLNREQKERKRGWTNNVKRETKENGKKKDYVIFFVGGVFINFFIYQFVKVAFSPSPMIVHHNHHFFMWVCMNCAKMNLHVANLWR